MGCECVLERPHLGVLVHAVGLRYLFAVGESDWTLPGGNALGRMIQFDAGSWWTWAIMAFQGVWYLVVCYAVGHTAADRYLWTLWRWFFVALLVISVLALLFLIARQGVSDIEGEYPPSADFVKPADVSFIEVEANGCGREALGHGGYRHGQFIAERHHGTRPGCGRGREGRTT